MLVQKLANRFENVKVANKMGGPKPKSAFLGKTLKIKCLKLDEKM